MEKLSEIEEDKEKKHLEMRLAELRKEIAERNSKIWGYFVRMREIVFFVIFISPDR